MGELFDFCLGRETDMNTEVFNDASHYKTSCVLCCVVLCYQGTGEAVHNTAHVSLVRYSRGGHLLAVVTGKLAQVSLRLSEKETRGSCTPSTD